ncbi:MULTISPECIES: hypothetical protein [Bacillus]|uniref:hypothetical protein n=1 Tax=Bacillus TaxID=1386 RepID=UPI000761CF23|nr:MULTISPECIES: hypothetical protein [Bacillus]AOC57742.1 hypothetical protein BEN31_13500 [Bacillus pumilus]AZV54722.1 hypothetical protein DKE43_17240 [Bacillus pumilus]MBR0587909.1 hypothetical protein [Bacillus pumilus DW2J2]MBR0617315.1 hypothetical protein [Bacillus pumilus]MBR0626241.1 hypothetical protein [Bacillus pumilus]
MLKVIDYKDSQPINIEYDLYTPINIEFGSWNISKEPTIYWRTGDFKKSLIEIGLGKYTGNIRSITLTLSENVHKMESLKLDMEDINMVKGVPSFQIEESNDNTYIDEKGKLDVYIGKDRVLISFSENDAVSILQNDTVGFVLDKEEVVCGILISGMLEHEKKTLEDALN